MAKVIVSNQVKCNRCGDTPWSGHRHDYRPCRCGMIAVDGGTDYLRRVGDIKGYTDMSIEIEDDSLNELILAAQNARISNRNDRGVVYAILRAMRDLSMIPLVSSQDHEKT